MAADSKVERHYTDSASSGPFTVVAPDRPMGRWNFQAGNKQLLRYATYLLGIYVGTVEG